MAASKALGRLQRNWERFGPPLRAELEGLPLHLLRERAYKLGVTKEKLEEVLPDLFSTDDTQFLAESKEKMVELLIAWEGSAEEPCSGKPERHLRVNPNCDGLKDPISLRPIPRGKGYCTGRHCIAKSTIERIRNDNHHSDFGGIRNRYVDPYNRENYNDADLAAAEIHGPWGNAGAVAPLSPAAMAAAFPHGP